VRIKQGIRRELDRDARQHIRAIQSPLPKMASTLCSSSTATPTLFSSLTLRRRLPLVGAFCMLSLGLSNLYTPLYSSALQTGCVLSLLRYSLFRRIIHSLFVSLSIEFNSIASVSDQNWVSAATPPSEWKQIAPLSPALLSMSLFPTRKQVLGLAREMFGYLIFLISLLFSCALMVVQVRSWLKALSPRNLQLVWTGYRVRISHLRSVIITHNTLHLCVSVV